MVKDPTTEAAPPGEMDQIAKEALAKKKFKSPRANGSELKSDDPKQLGRFSVRRVLGSGGMGTVYLGYDAQLERYVAIKLIRKGYMGNKNFAQRFEREAKIIAAISHPNIVQIHDWGIDPTYGSFIVLEFIDGENAFERVTRTGPLPLSLVCEILRVITEALNATHQQGIIHRDIKPGNILLSNSGSIKLTDLGIAKQLGKDDNRQLTGNHSPGTPGFMAPEQKKSLPLDIRADIYSLGKTFIFLLTEQADFNFLVEKFKLSRKTPGSATSEVRSADQKLLKTLLPIIRKMTEDGREKRYHSPEELLKDLDHVLQPSDRRRLRGIGIALLFCTAFALLGAAFFIVHPRKPKTPAQITSVLHSKSKGKDADISQIESEIVMGAITKNPSQINREISPNLQDKEDPSVKDFLTMVDYIKKSRDEHTSEDAWTSPPAIIMVLPMEFDSDIPMSKRKQFTHIPLGSVIKKFTNLPVVERESLKHLLKEYNLEVADLIDPEARVRLGKLLPASILLESLLFSIESNLALSAKIVSIETSEILAFVEAETEVSEPDPVHTLYPSVVSGLTDSIHKNLSLKGRIISVKGDLAEINLGLYHGVKEGMTFQIRKSIETARGYLEAGTDVVTQGFIEEIGKFKAYLKVEEAPEQAKPGMLIMEKNL